MIGFESDHAVSKTSRPYPSRVPGNHSSAPGLRQDYGGTSSSGARAIAPSGKPDLIKIRADIRAEEVAKLKRAGHGRIEDPSFQEGQEAGQRHAELTGLDQRRCR